MKSIQECNSDRLCVNCEGPLNAVGLCVRCEKAYQKHLAAKFKPKIETIESKTVAGKKYKLRFNRTYEYYFIEVNGREHKASASMTFHRIEERYKKLILKVKKQQRATTAQKA